MTGRILATIGLRKAGYYRWFLWGILTIPFMFAHFHRMSLGVIRDELVGEFGLSNIAFANISSMYFYIYMTMQIPAGFLADSIGARKTVAIGMILSGFGSIMFGFADNIGILFVGRFLIGLGVSVIFIAILKIISQWFKETDFAFLSALTSSTGFVGGILAQGPLALLVALITLRTTFLIIGVISFLLAIICYLFVRNTPADIGLPAIDSRVGIEQTAQEESKRPRLLEGLFIVIKNPRTWATCILFFGFYGAFIALTGVWGTSFFIDVYALPKVTAANYIMYAIIGSAIGSLMIGKLSDYIKHRKLPMYIFGGINVLCWSILVFMKGGKPPLQIMPSLMFILGFSSVSYILSWACSKEINPKEIAGISTSVVNVGGQLGAAFVPLILGFVFDFYGASLPVVQLYQKAFLCCLGAVFLALTATFLVKETHCQNIYKLSNKNKI